MNSKGIWIVSNPLCVALLLTKQYTKKVLFDKIIVITHRILEGLQYLHLPAHSVTNGIKKAFQQENK